MNCRIPAAVLLTWTVVASAALAQDTQDVKTLLEEEAALHPMILARDVYKMFYQAAFGVEHLLTDTAGTARYLERELASVVADSSAEPLLERISPDGRMVRVNLQPFKRLNLPPGMLVKAMFESAAETRPDTGLFRTCWNAFVALVRDSTIAAPPDMVEWEDRVQRGELHAVHHSPAYAGANSPAYRVVRRDVILPLLTALGIP
jgi:hypothetical protein